MTGAVWDYDEKNAWHTDAIVEVFPDGGCKVKNPPGRLSEFSTYLHCRLRSKQGTEV